ncbi:1-aminocyclopropane-1-carboxylate deaminase/D-cysteine desulfhydrase [Sphingobacterium faecium]|jgi:1-aminocyclopropane-1-carboxylate deaminase
MISFNFYSPEQKISLPDWQKKSVHVSIKRDDLIHPFISGNKWRKLKFNIQAALAQNKNHLVTFGGAWSNHILATACAGATFGLKTTAFLRADIGINNPVLAMCRLFGMELIYTDRSAYKNKSALFETHFHQNPDAYFIDEGGHGPLGSQGCEEIVSSLLDTYDHIFCACGTGTTLAGIQHAVSTSGLATQVHGIPVLKGGDFIQDEIQKIHPNASPVTLHTDYHFGGYAKTKPELIQFIEQFVSRTGIMIEPTYTGKLFFALDDLIAQDYFKTNARILVIHTGGLTGFLGMYERFNLDLGQ